MQETTVGPSITRFSYDGQSYGTAPTLGNLTAQSSWDDVDNKWITNSQTYNAYGNLVTKTDARGKVTQFYYDDSTHAAPNRVVVDPQNGTGTQTMTTVFDYSTGAVVSQTDANGNTATIDYTNQNLGTVDPLGRPGVTYAPAVTINGTSQQRRVRTYYDDHLLQVRTAGDLSTENDKLLKTRTTADMLGRVILSEQSEDGSTYTISTRKAYDTLHRMTFSSSPRRSGAATSDSWTRVTSDLAGRVTEVATFAGAAQPSASPAATVSGYTGSVTTTYDANFTTVTDQADKLRRSKVDGLGRLVRVDEPDGSNSLGSTTSPAQPTAYTYDVFGNLSTTVQGSQTRTFTYDALSRLRSAVNPESGTITYTYDDNGNLTQKTDARNITATYAYDALNRATSRSYSDSTPTVTYAYDAGSGVSNPKGKLISVSSSVSTYSYSGYDALGRVLGATQTIGGQDYSVGYGYDLAGHVVTEIYPSGNELDYSYDTAGRLSSFSGSLGDGIWRTYTSDLTYDASGRMGKENFGTDRGVYHTLWYNSRGQLAEIHASTSYTGPTDSSWNLGKIVNDSSTGTCSGVTCNGTDNNDNLLKQTVSIPNNAQNSSNTSWYQQYSYDSLNRLTQVHEYTGTTSLNWQQSFDYDRWGNRTINQSGTTQGIGINSAQVAIETAANRLYAPNDTSHTQINYDAAGNQTKDLLTGNGTRAFDAENRIITASESGSNANEYCYDGDGHRVKRYVAREDTETWQVYGANGELLGEYDADNDPATPKKEYGYRNGELLITAEPAPPCELLGVCGEIGWLTTPGAVQWLVTDQLGTPRMIFDLTGSLATTERHDYLPFGEELTSQGLRPAAQGYGIDAGVRQKFTSKERDSETGLDYFGARYYASDQGRFTTVDPLGETARISDPQTMNRYTFVLNNPLRYVDPDGLKEKTAWEELTAEERKQLTPLLVHLKHANQITQKELRAAGSRFNTLVTVAGDSQATADRIATAKGFVAEFSSHGSDPHNDPAYRQIDQIHSIERSTLQLTVKNKQAFLDGLGADGYMVNSGAEEVAKEYSRQLRGRADHPFDNARSLTPWGSDPELHFSNDQSDNRQFGPTYFFAHYDPTSVNCLAGCNEIGQIANGYEHAKGHASPAAVTNYYKLHPRAPSPR